MTRGEQLQQKLIKAHENCQAGHISQKAYTQIERSIIRRIKQYHREQYAFAMREVMAGK